MSQKEKTENGNHKFTVVNGSEVATQSKTLSTVEETEIDLLDLAYVFLDKLHYIVFFALLGAVLLNALCLFGVSPTYACVA